MHQGCACLYVVSLQSYTYDYIWNKPLLFAFLSNICCFEQEQVIAGVMDFLSMQIPPYVRIDLLQIIITRSLSAGIFFWICV